LAAALPPRSTSCPCVFAETKRPFASLFNPSHSGGSSSEHLVVFASRSRASPSPWPVHSFRDRDSVRDRPSVRDVPRRPRLRAPPLLVVGKPPERPVSVGLPSAMRRYPSPGLSVVDVPIRDESART